MILVMLVAAGVGCGSVGQGKTMRARPSVRSNDPLKTTKLVAANAAKARGIQKVVKKRARRYR